MFTLEKIRALRRIWLVVTISLSTELVPGAASQSNQSSQLFSDDFEGTLEGWQLDAPFKSQKYDSGDSSHGAVLALHPGGNNVVALIKGSESWDGYRVEGDVLFPEPGHSYLGFIYNYTVSGTRSDYGCLYIKGNGSYIRVNPHRDALVSRVLYEEYKTDLTGDSAVIPGTWQRFAAEVFGSTVHFYVGDMSVPKVTFEHFEFDSGMVGFEPRVVGAPVWIDNINARSISSFTYTGKALPPGLDYTPERMLTDWSSIGPLRERSEEIERLGTRSPKPVNIGQTTLNWKSISADGRGALITGRVFEYASQKNLAYFHTSIYSHESRSADLVVSSTNKLSVWLNGEWVGELEPSRFAWYDFLDVPDHESGRIALNMAEGINDLLILAESVGSAYTGDGLWASIQ